MKKVITMLAVLTSAVLTSALDNFITFAVNTNEAENTVNASVRGDINSDGKFDTLDINALREWLAAFEDPGYIDGEAADICPDGKLNVFDLCALKREYIEKINSADIIRVTNTSELNNALENAQAGDEIVLAEGEYISTSNKWFLFTSSSEGTEDQPIVIRSEDPEHPAVIMGNSNTSGVALEISGDWWEIRDLKFSRAQKGIVLDNSDHTKIINCEVYDIGSEGVHFRDNSSDCLAENCYVHDTGIVSPGSGEAFYVGSAQNTTEYGHECYRNTIRSCKMGPNVAAEHVDIKEYTIGTVVEDCLFDGTGMSGENFAKSFINIKGNDCVIRNNTGYRNGCTAILRAFEQNQVADGWGQNALVYGNTAYMDQAVNSTDGKMYFLNSWNCSVTVWDNFMAYDGELFSVDNEADHWKYYNCNMITYGSGDDLTDREG